MSPAAIHILLWIPPTQSQWLALKIPPWAIKPEVLVSTKRFDKIIRGRNNIVQHMSSVIRKWFFFYIKKINKYEYSEK